MQGPYADSLAESMNLDLNRLNQGRAYHQNNNKQPQVPNLDTSQRNPSNGRGYPINSGRPLNDLPTPGQCSSNDESLR